MNIDRDITEIDVGHNEPRFSPFCSLCKHYIVRLEGHTCDAFPNGIPDEIWRGENDHKKPYPGDHGIQFEHI